MPLGLGFRRGLAELDSGAVFATPPAIASILNLSQASGAYIVGDSVLFTITTSDPADLITTTGVDLYESGVKVGSAVQGPSLTWKITVSNLAVGAKSYAARRIYAGGTIDSAPSALTVLDVLAPNQITSATLVAWYQISTSGGVAGTLLKTAGTGTNAVTVTGNLQQPFGIKLTFPVGGVRGTATYSLSLDNGTTVFQTGTTAATVAIGATGMTLNFPTTSSYATTDIYVSVVNPILDKTANHYDTANTNSGERPLMIASGANGHPTARYDGIDDYQLSVSGLAAAAVGGTNAPFSVVGMCTLNAVPTGGNVANLYCFGHSSDVTLPRVELQALSDRWRIRRMDGTHNVALDSTIFPIVERYCHCWIFDGANSTLTLSGADVIGGDSGVSGAQAAANAISVNQFSLASQFTQVSPNGINFTSCDDPEISIFSGALSAVESARLQRYFMNSS